MYLRCTSGSYPYFSLLDGDVSCQLAAPFIEIEISPERFRIMRLERFMLALLLVWTGWNFKRSNMSSGAAATKKDISAVSILWKDETENRLFLSCYAKIVRTREVPRS